MEIAAFSDENAAFLGEREASHAQPTPQEVEKERLSAIVGECNEEKHKIINTKGKIMSSKIIKPEMANCRSDTTKLNGIHDFVLHDFVLLCS